MRELEHIGSGFVWPCSSLLCSYLVVPSIAAFPLEAHPFTIVNAPSDRGSDDDDVTFLLRVRDGFTKRLFMAAQQQVQAADEKLDGRSLAIVRNLPIYIEGPYGAAKSSGHHDVALFIAGESRSTFNVADKRLTFLVAHSQAAPASPLPFLDSVNYIARCVKRKLARGRFG